MSDYAKELRRLEIRLDREDVTVIQPLMRELAGRMEVMLRVVRAAEALNDVRYDDLETRADAFDELRAALDNRPTEEGGDDADER